jgi:AraC-like DNA-binding protein
MSTEQVRIWRPRHEDRALLIAGRTTRYAIEPRGEYVFGIVAGQPMRARRGRETHLVRPGQLVAWDPSAAHSGTAMDGRPWTSLLMLVEVGDLAALASDAETEPLADVSFPDPVVSDPRLASSFVRLHAALGSSPTRLEGDERLAEWLAALTARGSARRRERARHTLRDDRAVHRAGDYLRDRWSENVGLDELAAVAGIGKFRLIRIFNERTGLTPHAFQVAQRVRAARRLLEAGESVGRTALVTGFADQSHLHRHFRRSVGMTPGQYQRRFVAVRG